MAEQSSAKFKFNNMQEIKSHSSVLYNERMAILFYWLDMKNLELYANKHVDNIRQVHSILRQIYKNIRMLLRNNPTVRATLNLDTKVEGIYTLDVAMGTIQNLISYCDKDQYTERRIEIIIREMDNAELLVRDILQYFQYFIRPDFRQKPDVDMATERYKEMADTKTIEELRSIAGKRHGIDFEGLGSERVELNERDDDFDVVTDGVEEDQNEVSELDFLEDDDEIKT